MLARSAKNEAPVRVGRLLQCAGVFVAPSRVGPEPATRVPSRAALSSGVEELVPRRAHIPEVAGSSPAPATAQWRATR